MIGKKLFSRWIAFMILFFGTISLFADGFIVIHPPVPRPRPIRIHYFPLSVKYHHVTTEIQDQVAVTKIDQVFYNPNPRQLEGTYIFPLPERATLKQFSMYMNGKEVQGELLDRDKARQIYISIVRRMQDPALLEYVGRGMFRARVFPIPARGETRIKLSYSELLPADSNLVEYVYPLNTEKFSSRPLDEVVITVNIRSKSPLKTIYSPTHQVDIVRRGAGWATVGFERKRVRPDKDFKLIFSRSNKSFALDLLSAKPSSRKDGYFLMILSPPSQMDKESVLPKDVVFVVDTSGSMMGDRMSQAKKALKYCVQALSEKDRFSIIDFSTEARSFSENLVKADQNGKKDALSYIDQMVARGGTNIHEALLKALAMEKEKQKGRPFMICFMTDGEPTVGEVIEPEGILKAVKKANTHKVRIFVLGIGDELNVKLLDKLAEENGGAQTYIGEKENMEVKISNFFNKISYPALSDISIQFSKNIRVYDVYPRKIPDLFIGGQIQLLGRYRGHGSVAVTLKGFKGEQKIEQTFEGRLVESGGLSEIAPLWANKKIAYLLDQIRLHGEKQELKNEIVRLAKKFGIVTPYTS
ncbi:MAG: VWA domain-containing protein, partial [Planctomycetota bacterium]